MRLLLFCLISFLIHLFPTTSLFGQSCDTTNLATHKVSASLLDPNITPFELNQHYAFFNSSCTSRDKLVFYLVGTHGNPKLNLLFTKMAANNGFHVISIKYPNNKSATTACSTDNDTTCYENFHKEAIFGTDLCQAISIDSTNSIYTRSVKLLQHLSTNYPSENWSQFLTGNDIDWTKVITAGHSQGAGHSAYLAHIFPVARGLMFAGPNEYMNNYNRSAPWFSEPSVTADSNYYGFGNINDEFNFDKQFIEWQKLGLPNHGDTVDITTINCPYNNTRMLFTSDDITGGLWSNHGSVISDEFTPLDGLGYPAYENVWKYMLGLCPLVTGVTEISNSKNIRIFPIPAKNYLVIQSDETISKINLLNTVGQVVIRIEEINQFRKVVDIKKLPSGAYFININSGKTNTIRKIILN